MKQDLLSDCNRQGMAVQEFTEMFCQRCKQKKCERASWGTPRMERRVQEQERRLLHPIQVDPALDKYEAIVKASDFKDMLHRAAQLEISNRRNDWEVPEIPVRDGQVEVNRPDPVDDALRAMARRQGRDEPQFFATAEPDPEPPAPEPKISSLAPPSPAKPVVFVPPTAKNTATPQGVVIGGGPPPPREAPRPPIDPWAPPSALPEASSATKVKVGATVKMGGK